MLAFSNDVAPYEIAFEAYGVEVRICSNSSELRARMEPFLPPGALPCPPTPAQHRLGILLEADGTYSVYNDGTLVVGSQGLELSLVALDGQLRRYVALHAPDKTFVHAGAVARDGRAMIFPGHSFAGKTTLVAALVRAGAVYYSDEFAVLDADGLIHPYAKPLSLRNGPGPEQVETPVEQLGGAAGQEPLPLGLAVLTRYRAGAEWRPKRISPGAAAMALVSYTATVRSRPELAMRAITRTLEDAVALEGERGEADAIVEQLLDSVPA